MANDQALDTLQIEINASGTSAADGIQKLADAVRQLRSAVGRNGSGLSGLANALNSLNNAVKGVDNQKVESTATAISALGKAMQDAQAATTGMTGFKQALSGLSGVSGDIQRTADAMHDLVEQVQNGLSGQGQGTSRTEDALDEIGDATEENAERAEEAQRQASIATSGHWKTAVSAISKIFSKLTSVLKGIGRAIVKSIITPLQLMGRAALSAANKVKNLALNGLLIPFRAVGGLVNKVHNLIRAFGRIALYRALRTAIKAITQGLQEGVQNLYQWSLLMDHTFANSMDSIATSMQYLHNGFAAMFSPLIEYAAPILEEITNKVVDFFNIIQQIFATLTGQTTWHKAIRVQKQYGDQIAETGQAAEKAMHQLMAFDELNVINSPSAGGSGGSGQQTPDYGSMFTTEEVDTQLTSWVQDIMDFFNSGEFYNLGKYIADKLNGLVSQWDALGSGFKFGEKIRHALETFNGFLENFEFADLGEKVAEWFIGLWDGVNPATVIQFFRNVLTAIRDFVSGFIGRIIKEWEDRTGLAFDEFGRWLADTLNKKVQNWNSYLNGFNLGEKIKTVLHQINAFLKTFNFFDLGEKLGDWLAGLIDGLTTDEIADAIAGAINAALDLGGGLLKKLQAQGVPLKIGEAIGKAFAGINWSSAATILNAIVSGIIDIFKGAISSFFNNGGWEKVWEGFKELSLPAKLLLTLPIVFELAKGASLAALIMSSLGLAGAALPIAIIGGGLAITISLIFSAVNDIEDLTGWPDPLGINHSNPAMDAQRQDYIDFTQELRSATGFLKSVSAFRNIDGRNHGTSGGHKMGASDARVNAASNRFVYAYGDERTTRKVAESIIDTEENTRPSKSSGGFSGLPGIKNPFANDINIPFKLNLKKALGDELNQAGGILDASAFPAKVGALGTKAADMLKNGVKNANIPKVFDDEATVSATKFGSHDFSPGGLHAGEGIKTGVDRADLSGKMASVREGMLSKLREGDFEGNGKNIMDRTGNGIDSVNLPQKIANTAASMLNSLRWAGWESVGAQIGDAAGANFKPHFKQHLQTSITLYGSGGTPLTTVYAVPYAQGGFPSQGSLFLAGEMAGQAEMIGTINGRTGVASGREITGISDAVYATGNEEASLLRQTNILLQALLAKDPFGTPNSNAGRWITQSQQAYKAVKG